jgi:hypothetical protein
MVLRPPQPVAAVAPVEQFRRGIFLRLKQYDGAVIPFVLMSFPIANCSLASINGNMSAAGCTGITSRQLFLLWHGRDGAVRLSGYIVT